MSCYESFNELCVKKYFIKNCSLNLRLYHHMRIFLDFEQIYEKWRLTIIKRKRIRQRNLKCKNHAKTNFSFKLPRLGIVFGGEEYNSDEVSEIDVFKYDDLDFIPEANKAVESSDEESLD